MEQGELSHTQGFYAGMTLKSNLTMPNNIEETYSQSSSFQIWSPEKLLRLYTRRYVQEYYGSIVYNSKNTLK